MLLLPSNKSIRFINTYYIYPQRVSPTNPSHMNYARFYFGSSVFRERRKGRTIQIHCIKDILPFHYLRITGKKFTFVFISP